MDNNELKKETVGMIDMMVEHADKGPSGFWVEDYEGCGNPDIFPEFDEGLKHGRLVQKQHFCCPWNTAIMYGDGHGNIVTGCYYSCSIDDARYLSKDMLIAALNRFRKGLHSGQYDQIKHASHIEPLLTPDEQKYILKRKAQEKAEQKMQEELESEQRKIKASKLLKKYADREDLCSLLCVYYGTNQIVDTDNMGLIFFSPNSRKEVVGAEHLSYNAYIDAQIRTAGKYRADFLNCYMNIPSEFKGEVERIDSVHNRLCFKKVFVTGMFQDDCSFFDGKEEHVWMSGDGFGKCAVGDCFTFFADVYRYVKTGNGRTIDYGLHNPKDIKRIDRYSLPSNKELALQNINLAICDTCYLSDYCSHVNCMRIPEEIQEIRKTMLRSMGDVND